jgi:hypothetical protein
VRGLSGFHRRCVVVENSALLRWKKYLAGGRRRRFSVSNFAQTPSSHGSKCSKRTLKCSSIR